MNDVPRRPGVPEARQDVRLRRYPLRRLKVPVGGRTLSVVVPDAAACWREGGWTEGLRRGGEPPYWLRVWPAAVQLARLLARARSLSGLQVLDLGCGLAVPGSQAADMGAAVTLADQQPDALAFARWNARNQPGCTIEPRLESLDWAHATVAGPFDLILASDVTYHESHHEPVRRQVLRGLAPDGCLVHADPLRPLSTRFLELLGRELALVQVRREGLFDGRRVEIRLSVACRSTESLDTWCRRFELGAACQGAPGAVA